MLRNLLLSASLTMLGFTAQAQPGAMPAAPQSPASEPPAAPSASQSGVDAAAIAKPGMVVKDSAGATVGTVVQAGRTAEGVSAVVVQVDGRPFTLAASSLTPAGDGLVSSMSKTEIKAASPGR
jgi:hypothetical protein